MSLVKGWQLLFLCLCTIFVVFSESQVQSLAFTLSLFANRKQPVIDESDDSKIPPPPKPDLADLLSRNKLPPINTNKKEDKSVPMAQEEKEKDDKGTITPEIIMSESPIIEDAKRDDAQSAKESENADDNLQDMRKRINDMLNKRKDEKNSNPKTQKENPSQKKGELHSEKLSGDAIDKEEMKPPQTMQQPLPTETIKMDDISVEEVNINDGSAKDTLKFESEKLDEGIIDKEEVESETKEPVNEGDSKVMPPQTMQQPPMQKETSSEKTRELLSEKLDDGAVDKEEMKPPQAMQQPPMTDTAKVENKQSEKSDDNNSEKQDEKAEKTLDVKDDITESDLEKEKIVEMEVETDGNVHKRSEKPKEYQDDDEKHYKEELEEFKKYDPEDDEVEDDEFPDDDEADDALDKIAEKKKQNDAILDDMRDDELLQDQSGYLATIADGMDVLFEALRKFKTRSVVIDDDLNESDFMQLYKECTLKLDKLEKSHSASSTVEIDAGTRILNTFVFVFVDIMFCLLCYPRQSSILAFSWTFLWMTLALASYLMNESNPLFIVLGVNAIFPLMTQSS